MSRWLSSNTQDVALAVITVLGWIMLAAVVVVFVKACA